MSGPSSAELPAHLQRPLRSKGRLLLVMVLDEPEDRIRKTTLDAPAASRSIPPTVAQAYNRLLRRPSDSEAHS
jgi:hypothetical protein